MKFEIPRTRTLSIFNIILLINMIRVVEPTPFHIKKLMIAIKPRGLQFAHQIAQNILIPFGIDFLLEFSSKEQKISRRRGKHSPRKKILILRGRKKMECLKDKKTLRKETNFRKTNEITKIKVV